MERSGIPPYPFPAPPLAPPWNTARVPLRGPCLHPRLMELLTGQAEGSCQHLRPPTSLLRSEPSTAPVSLGEELEFSLWPTKPFRTWPRLLSALSQLPPSPPPPVTLASYWHPPAMLYLGVSFAQN